MLGIIACALVAVIITLVLLLHLSDAVTVMTTSPQYRDIESSVITNGRVTPIEDFQARANFAGVVEKIEVHLGEQVQAGQMLVRMKDPYAEQRVLAAKVALQSTKVSEENVQRGGSVEERFNLQAELEHAQLERAAAASSLSKLTTLQQVNAASDAEVRAAIRRLKDADTTLQSATRRFSERFSASDKAAWKMRIQEARSSLTAADVSLANANIVSPIAGTVYLLPVSTFDFVSAGAELMHVADLNKLQVRAPFDEPDMGKLHEGSQVEIRWEGRVDRVWHGIVRHIPMAATTSGTRNVGESIITIADARGDLPANTNVTVTVQVSARSHVLCLPREALQTQGDQSYVYRVVSDQLVRTPVTLGLLNRNDFEITSGLSERDVVALHSADNRPLSTGMRVKIRP
ncbi:MAG: efflux RND transporter periplasmic adaptor subunit [Janthinobacterium lividum]